MGKQGFKEAQQARKQCSRNEGLEHLRTSKGKEKEAVPNRIQEDANPRMESGDRTFCEPILKERVKEQVKDYLYKEVGHGGKSCEYKDVSLFHFAERNPDHTTTFTYGFDRSRFARVDVSGAGVTRTTQYLGSVEKITSSDKPNEIQWKRYLGKSAIITITTDTQNNQVNTSDREERYVYNDHLGATA